MKAWSGHYIAELVCRLMSDVPFYLGALALYLLVGYVQQQDQHEPCPDVAGVVGSSPIAAAGTAQIQTGQQLRPKLAVRAWQQHLKRKGAQQTPITATKTHGW